MSRFAAFLIALLLSFSYAASAVAESPISIPLDLLGGTSWRDAEGVEYHFTADAGIFFSHDPTQLMYVRIGSGLYFPTPSNTLEGPFLVLDSMAPCTFTLDGSTLSVTDLADRRHFRSFTHIDYTAALAGTRWLSEHGDIFEFNDDCTEFNCWTNAHFFNRTQSSLGAYYEMTIGMDGERYYDPSSPFAFHLNDGKLMAYKTEDGKPILWQVFTPAVEE